jgi:hypothetical protein
MEKFARVKVRRGDPDRWSRRVNKGTQEPAHWRQLLQPSMTCMVMIQ